MSPSTVRKWKSRHKWPGPDERNSRDTNAAERQARIDGELQDTLATLEGLTEKQKLFVMYYVKTRNATQSYQRAHGCAYSTALSAGPRAIGNYRIAEAVERCKAIYDRELMLDVTDIAITQMHIACADMTAYAEWGPGFVRLRDSTQVDGALVAEVKQGRDGMSIKLHDKQKAIDWLTKHHLKLGIDADNGESGELVINILSPCESLEKNGKD